MMDAIICQDRQFDVIERIREIAYMCRISKFEEMLSQNFENLPESKSLNYIGELNKNDIMQ